MDYVLLDYPIARELPVQVDWVGLLPRGLLMEKLRVEPDHIKVVGGGQVLDQINTIYTEKVPLENLRQSGQITVGLALESPALKIADGFKNKVVVDYTLAKRKR